MIPQIIHQTWKRKTGLSQRHEFWRSTFTGMNPSFQHPLYDDADNRALVEKFTPTLLPVYQSFPLEINRVDFVRTLYLFFFGGFYADLDFQCLNPFSRYCALGEVLFGRMGVENDFVHSIPNALMASPQFDGFWIFYLRHMIRLQTRTGRDGGLGVEEQTGPVALRQAILEYVKDHNAAKNEIAAFLDEHPMAFDRSRLCFHPIRILPSRVWYPIDWSDNLHQMFRQKVFGEGLILSTEEARRLFPMSDAVTYWEHSW
jgi:mannosyltransferase OCH1-like enzyme